MQLARIAGGEPRPTLLEFSVLYGSRPSPMQPLESFCSWVCRCAWFVWHGQNEVRLLKGVYEAFAREPSEPNVWSLLAMEFLGAHIRDRCRYEFAGVTYCVVFRQRVCG